MNINLIESCFMKTKNKIFKYLQGGIFIAIFSFFFNPIEVKAQTPDYSYTKGSDRTAIPFSTVDTALGYRMQLLYPPGEFGHVNKNMLITKLYLRAQNAGTVSTFEEVEISLGQDNPVLYTWLDWDTNTVRVKYDSLLTLGPTVPGQWLEFELDTPFRYNPDKALVIDLKKKATKTGGFLLLTGGKPSHPGYLNWTNSYARYGDATAQVLIRNLYHFGFDLKPEFENNAGVSELASPKVFCIGSHDVYATIVNNGTNQIDSVDVYWEIDGIPQGSVKYTGLLDTLGGNNPSSAQVLLGNYNFQTSVNVTIYTDMPNGVNDTINFDDTLNIDMGPALSGMYSVSSNLPAGPSNFTSVSSMLDALNSFGICGPTLIYISSGTYSEALDLSDIKGLSAINTLTIDGGDSSATIFTQSGSFSTLRLNNVKHITVKNLSFINTRTTGSAILFHNADSNVVSSCIAWVDPQSTNSNLDGVLFSADPASRADDAKTHYNTVEHSKIIGGYHGIYMYGVDTALVTGNRLMYNEIDSSHFYGIKAFFSNDLHIEGNKINMLNRNFGNSNAISLFAANAKILGNDIKAVEDALSWSNRNYTFSSSKNKQLINNMAFSTTANAVYLDDVDSLEMYHNSMYSTGTAVGFPLYVLNPTGKYDIRNNIFYSDNNLSFYLYRDTVIKDFNYNIFYTGGSNLLSFGGNTYASLSNFQTAVTGWNSKSLEGDPGFVSPYDLHVQDSLANDVGDTTVGVWLDIDLETRPDQYSPYGIVDIRADEFYPVTCPSPMVREQVKNYNSIMVRTDVSDIEFKVIPCGASADTATVYYSTSDTLFMDSLAPAECYSYYIRTICGRGDSSLWIGPFDFMTNPTPPMGVNCNSGNLTTIFSEEFETPAANGWTGDINTSSGISTGMWNVGSGGSSFGSRTGPSAAQSGSTYLFTRVINHNNQMINLYSPRIDLTTVQDSAELSFWLHAFGSDLGEFSVGISNNLAGPYTNLMSFDGNKGELQESSAEPFYQVGLRLDDYVGQNVYLEFSVRTASFIYGEFALDLLEVKGCISCLTPDSLEDVNKELSSVDLDWVEKGNSTSWEIAYDSSWTSHLIPTNRRIVNSKPATINNLSAGDTYRFYVRSICGNGDSSAWFGPFIYTTPFEIPFVEDFESFSTLLSATEVWPNGWKQHRYALANDPQWMTQSGPTNSANTGPEVDHTTSGAQGIYSYLTMEGAAGDSTDLISPYIYIDPQEDSLELEYWYHFYGSNIDQMKVYIEVNGMEYLIDTIIGQQQTAASDPWQSRTLPLIGFEDEFVKIKFRGFNHYPKGEIAIDDISIRPYTIVGVNENTKDVKQLILYPNPTKEAFTLKSSGLKHKNALVSLRNISGQLILSEIISESDSPFIKHFNIKNNAKGIYILTIIDGDNLINKKLIIQ